MLMHKIKIYIHHFKFAAYNHFYDAAKILIESGASLLLLNNKGETPLHRRRIWLDLLAKPVIREEELNLLKVHKFI